MFKQIILYKAVCDGCGEHFENSGCETHPPYFTQEEVHHSVKTIHLQVHGNLLMGSSIVLTAMKEK
jgi:hypothetical protein